MGRLTHLEVENFKSYEGKQVVGPFDNFTCIIGPNGAGKSNMMDAISFVLGVQSRHLRSSHLKELVFRKDADAAPARKASVTLFYEASAGEVEGREEGDVMVFGRSISAAGVSSYKLDRRDVTYDRYEQTLQEIGVLVKARNFLVFQGDVEAVASKSPQDLTKLLEQISGSDQYIAEYEDLLRRKAEAEENTIFSMQKKKMYSTQCREVRGQKDEAEYFQDKQGELGDRKTEYVLWQIWCVKSEMEGKQDAADALREELQVVQGSETGADAEIADGKRDLAKESKALTSAEKSAASVAKQLEAVTPKLNETRAKLKSLGKRQADLGRSMGRVGKDLDQQAQNVSGLEGDIAALEEAEGDLKEQLESAADEQSGLKLDAAGLQEYSRLREEVSARIAAQRADELTLGLDLKGKQELLERLSAQEEALRREGEAGEKLVAECQARHQFLSTGVETQTAEQVRLTAERGRMHAAMMSSETQLKEHNNELEELAAKLREAGDDRRRGKQEERMGEAILSMQRIFKGVHGKLADLCRPIQRKYAQAVSVAAGKHMDAVVVDNKAAAQECIRYLKDQRVGTCTFLPLDSLAVKPLSERMRSFGARYRPCVDLLECEEQYRVAVAYAVDATLVCDSLEDARELCFQNNERVKVVTLKGHSIGKSGAMTGGAPPREGQDRWEEREVEGWRARRSEVESMVTQLVAGTPTRQQLMDVESKLRAAGAKIRLNDTDLTVVKQKIKHLQQQKGLRRTSQDRLAQEIGTLGGEVQSLEARLSEVHGSVQAVEAEVFGAFSAQMGIANIREYEETALKKHQQLLLKSSAVSKQLSELTAQLAYERKRDFQGVLKRLEKQVADAGEEQARLEELDTQLLEEELRVRALLRAANEKVGLLKTQREELLATLKAAQGGRAEVLRDKERLSKRLAGEEILIERGRTQLHDILQKARVDEVALPTTTSTTSSTADEEEGVSSRSKHSSRDSEELAWEGTHTQTTARRRTNASLTSGSEHNSESGDSERQSSDPASTHFSQPDNPTVVRDSRAIAHVDLTSMRKKYRNLTKTRTDDIEKNMQGSIAELAAELESIQPNMHAAERYEGVVDRLRECSDELEGTKETARSLSVRFEEVRQRRLSLFSECFGHVSEALGTIYKDLTRSGKHPLGGNAYLTLDNTEEPFLGGIRFNAMPPMKRFRDMDQLSGGEKTMAALALLFSVHSFRQAPFFVLDEVDAALDNVNVKKICNYIKQRSKEFQCIVISLK
ncbi:RecF/RecN/SMC, partial [Ochromonadaceae sp. CCMP2298]